MARHCWRARAELEADYESFKLPAQSMPDHGCIICGAAMTLMEGESLPDEGCVDLSGSAPPA